MKRTIASLSVILCAAYMASAQKVLTDTLATANPAKVIVVNPNNTWQCVNLPDFDSFVDESDWDNKKLVPYDFSLDFVPEKTYFCLSQKSGDFCLPCKGKVVTKYGTVNGHKHQGVDIEAAAGTAVKAAFDGKVRIAGTMDGYGKLVVIRHQNGLETFYGLLASIDVPLNAMVKAGDVLGSVGNVGETSESRLHFETRYQGYAIDPSYFIKFSSGKLVHDVMVLRKSALSDQMRYVPESDADEIALAQAAAEANAEAARKEAEKAAQAAKAKAEKEAKAKAAQAAKAKAAKAQQWYTVKSGDTLSKIAAKNHTTVSALCKLNNIKATTTLQIGKKLRLK